MSNPRLFPPSPAHCAFTGIEELITTVRITTAITNIPGRRVNVDSLFKDRLVIL
jgi:hypothetical protein